MSVPLVYGDVQTTNAPVSTRHSNAAPVSPVNVNCGWVTFVGPVGPPVMAGATGLVVSTLKAREAAGPRLPATSVWRTWKVCGPAMSVPLVYGDVQTTNAPVSTRHSN